MRELLEIGKRGLTASSRSLDVVGHNIANVNTPGYSRQRAELSPVDYKKGGISIGLGVNVNQVRQLRDEIVERQIREREGELGNLDEQAKVYGQIEVLFSSNSENDLDKLITKFFNSFSELSNNPESIALRNSTINAGSNLTLQFNELAANLDTIQNSVADDVRIKIQKVNSLITDIAELNASIANGASKGQPDNYSLDLRAQRINELATFADVTVTYESNEMAEIRIGNLIVVQGSNYNQISPEFDSTNQIVRIRLNNGRSFASVGGNLGASMEAYSNIVPSYKEKLNTLAESLVTKVNQIHVNGYNLENNTGIDFFQNGNTKASNIALNTAIIDNPERIAASDSINEPGNNQAALNIFSLLDDISAVDGQSFIDYSLGISSETGFKLNNINTRLESNNSAKQQLMEQQSQVSGVNIDEELTNMIRFQNAYQASAKVIAAADEMYATLLSIV